MSGKLQEGGGFGERRRTGKGSHQTPMGMDGSGPPEAWRPRSSPAGGSAKKAGNDHQHRQAQGRYPLLQACFGL